MMEALKVTVYSDYICPYCYLGKYRLEEIKAEYDLDVSWVGFEIHPEFPVSGIPFKLANSSGFMNGLIKRINTLAEEMKLEPIQYADVLPNTHLALELSEASREENLFDKINDTLFEAYFKQGKHIGDKDVLRSIGKEVGMSEGLIDRCIGNGEFAQVVEKARQQAFSDLVTGVPTYMIEGFPILGVQTMDTIRMTIDRIIAKKEQAASS